MSVSVFVRKFITGIFYIHWISQGHLESVSTILIITQCQWSVSSGITWLRNPFFCSPCWGLSRERESCCYRSRNKVEGRIQHQATSPVSVRHLCVTSVPFTSAVLWSPPAPAFQCKVFKLKWVNLILHLMTGFTVGPGQPLSQRGNIVVMQIRLSRLSFLLVSLER